MTYIFVSGLWSTSKIFQPISRVIQSEICSGPVINPPTYYQAGKTRSWDEAVADLSCLLKTTCNHSRNVTLVGHSFGGLLSRAVLSEDQTLGKKTGLVLLSPSPENPIRIPIRSSIRTFKPRYFKHVLMGTPFSLGIDDIETMFGSNPNTVSDGGVTAVSSGRLVRSVFLQHRFREPMCNENGEPLGVQRLLITGEDDPTCGPKTLGPWARGYHHEVLSGADHYGLLTQPRKIVELMFSERGAPVTFKLAKKTTRISLPKE